MKVDRLVSIIMILLDKKRIGAQELSDMFEVSKRTIYRYIDAINMAGIPVSSVPGTFEYADRYGNKTARTAEPYQLVLKNGHWYWQGYCHERNDFRLFKLSRTSNLHIQEEFFTPREHEKPQLSFTDVLETLQIQIKIRIHESVMARVLEYCPLDHFLPDGKDQYLVDFPFIENDYYYTILLGFGDTCECLEPLHIRAEMKRRIQNMAALYER